MFTLIFHIDKQGNGLCRHQIFSIWWQPKASQWIIYSHPKIKLFLESNRGDDDDNHYCVFYDDVDGDICDDVEDADDWDEQGIMIVVVCAEQPVLKHF